MVRTVIALLACAALCGCPQLLSDDFVMGGQAGGAASPGGGGLGGGGGGAASGGGGAAGGGGDAGAGGDVEPTCQHEWSKRYPALGDQSGRSVAIDSEGNVLVTGDFSDAIDFGGNVLTSAGETDVFVAKLALDGSHVWSLRFGDGQEQVGRGVALDGAGNVVITGGFHGSIDFGGNVLTSEGGTDVFVAKLDRDGHHLWSLRFGDGEEQIGRGVAVDSLGNVVLTGSLAGSADFGGDVLTAAGETDIFVAKLDRDGHHLWSLRFGDEHEQVGRSVAVDSLDNVVLTGELSGNADFGGGVLASVDQRDMFLVQLDPTGAHRWSKRFGGTGDQSGLSVAVDPAGSARVTGAFVGTIDFGGGELSSAAPGTDAFLSRFADSGSHMWSKRFGDSSDQQGNAIAVDANGNSVIAGALRGTTDFGGGPLTAPGTANDAFLAKFAAGGEHLCSLRFGDADGQSGNGVATRANGGFVITGSARGTVDFGGGPLDPGDGDLDDVFVASFAP